jgi:transposase
MSRRPIYEVATELGINDQTLRNWLFAARAENPEAEEPTTSDEQAEVARLRRRVRVLEQERDILKKAAAWFAKETDSTP